MRARSIALATVLLGGTGLVAPAPGAAQQSQEGRQAQAITVAVHNRFPSSVRVYALQAGHMVPIGTVERASDATLSIPAAFAESAEPLQLVVDPLEGEGWYESEPLASRSSGQLDLTVAETLDRSTASAAG
ncbi:MAG: hypothetical protein AB7T31_10705 [Gemmatimonadales bacterium]